MNSYLTELPDDQRASLMEAISESTKQITYWTMQKVQTADVEERRAAGARVLAWQSNRRCKIAALDALATAPPGADPRRPLERAARPGAAAWE